MIASSFVNIFAWLGVVAYSAAAAYVVMGLRRRLTHRSDEPPISIVIPVRNEERALPRLLESLAKLDYPKDRTEIIIVNDQSTDQTRQIADSFQAITNCPVQVIDVNPNGETLIAKTRPLAQGIERASHDFILMTDADCVVPPGWAKGIVSHFTENVGMVCGMTLPVSQNGHAQVFHKFERLDWYYLLGVAAGFTGSGKPQALIGNNYAVRRSTYMRLGGFRNMAFNKIDDISLMSAIRAEGVETVVMPADPCVLIETQPVKSFRDLVQQRQRWLKAWPYAAPMTKLALVAGFIIHATAPVWPLLFGWMSIPMLALLFASDAAVVLVMRARFNDKSDAGSIWLYPLFVCAYGIALAVNVLTGKKINWKDRDF